MSDYTRTRADEEEEERAAREQSQQREASEQQESKRAAAVTQGITDYAEALEGLKRAKAREQQINNELINIGSQLRYQSWGTADTLREREATLRKELDTLEAQRKQWNAATTRATNTFKNNLPPSW